MEDELEIELRVEAGVESSDEWDEFDKDLDKLFKKYKISILEAWTLDYKNGQETDI